MTIGSNNTLRGCLWDAVENTVLLRTTKSGSVTYLKSTFLHEDASGNDYAELDFHAAVPAELQTKYETISSTFAVAHPDRDITGMTVEKDRATGIVTATVSFTYGVSGDNDILYIVWDTEDKGETLAAWGDNYYCAGEVADDATGATVALPAGKYPLVFRAFLMTPRALDCDSFTEYLLSDGTSYIETDWKHIKGDVYAIKFLAPTQPAGGRLFGCGYSSSAQTSTVEAYISGGKYRIAVDGPSAVAFGSSGYTHLNAAAENVISTFCYDSKTGVTSAEYSGSEHLTTEVVGTYTAEQNSYLDIFTSRRTRTGNSPGYMPENSRFYSFKISHRTEAESDPVLCHYYIPALKDGEYGVWDAVENEFTSAPSSNKFKSVDETGEIFSSVPFSAVSVPEELRQKWFDSTVVSDVACLPMEGTIISIR